jgi:hypothetical protein
MVTPSTIPGILIGKGTQMNVGTILEQIDEEISRLNQARALLTDEPVKRSVGRPKKDLTVIVPKRRKMSAAGRAKIAAAQKARWAAKKAPAKKTIPAPKKPVASAPAK